MLTQCEAQRARVIQALHVVLLDHVPNNNKRAAHKEISKARTMKTRHEAQADAREDHVVKNTHVACEGTPMAHVL